MAKSKPLVIANRRLEETVEALRKAILWGESVSAKVYHEGYKQINWTYLQEARRVYNKMKKKLDRCGKDCEMCIICEKSKLCCYHKPKPEHHGCVTWKRK